MKYSKVVDSFSFLYKYWLPIFILCIIYVISAVIVCYSVNYKNDSLEKQSGVIENFKVDVTPTSSWTWYIMNFKLKGDSIIYAQEWRILNYSLLRHFLLGNRKITEGEKFSEGTHIEFYKNKNSETYPYLIVDNAENKPHKGKYILKKTEEVKIVPTYGLIINNDKVFNYTKRGFATPLLGKLMIGLLILCIPLLVITLFYVNKLLTRFISKLTS